LHKSRLRIVAKLNGRHLSVVEYETHDLMEEHATILQGRPEYALKSQLDIIDEFIHRYSIFCKDHQACDQKWCYIFQEATHRAAR
jgi:hypothetical protein